MNAATVLNWLREQGMEIAFAIFFLGLLFRLLQNLFLGRDKNLAPARGAAFTAGLSTVVTRTFSFDRLSYRGYFTLIAGYLFHFGFLLTLFFLSQHIALFKSIVGFSWPALSPALIDISAVLAIAALFAVLIHRLVDPVLRQISDYQDYLAWLLTMLPLVSGFMTMHPLGFSYQTALLIHIASFELLIIAIPFTKLSHVLSIFISRWYNGAIAGYKGVKQ